MPPAPLPTRTPAPGSWSRSPASCHASDAAMTAMSEAREYRRGSDRAPRSRLTYSRSVPAPPGPAAPVFLYLYELRQGRDVANPSVAAFTSGVLLFTVFGELVSCELVN